MKFQKVPTYLIASLAASLLSACGSSGVTGDPSTMLPQDNGGYIDDDFIPGAGSNAYPLTFKSVGRPLNEQQNGIPSTASISQPLRTDTMLIVKVQASAATRNENTPVYTNFTANYSCATLRVTLQMEDGNGVYSDFASVDTDRLSVPGTSGCAGSVASQTIDFSGYMVPGHGNFKIKVESLTSNFNCLAAAQYPFRYPYNYVGTVCAANPMQSIYQYHVVNGKLQVQVNGTVFN